MRELKVAKLIDVLSESGEEISQAVLMKKLHTTNTEYLQSLLDIAREEIGIFTITKPGGYVGYKINYGDGENG